MVEQRRSIGGLVPRTTMSAAGLRPATHRQRQLLPRADQVLRAADGIGPGQTARAATAVFARNRSQGFARAYRISGQFRLARLGPAGLGDVAGLRGNCFIQAPITVQRRSEEHTSELQSLMRISYAVFCLKKKNT